MLQILLANGYSSGSEDATVKISEETFRTHGEDKPIYSILLKIEKDKVK